MATSRNDIPDEDEEYELLNYGEESLEEDNEFNPNTLRNIGNIKNPTTITKPSSKVPQKSNAVPSEDEELELLYQNPVADVQKPQNNENVDNHFPSVEEEDELFQEQQSHVIEQIENSQGTMHLTSEFGGLSQISGGPVNRRLFSNKRVASTPMARKETMNDLYGIDDDVTHGQQQQHQRDQGSRKRRLDRDIYYVDVDKTDSITKKMKADEEYDMQLIQRILESRSQGSELYQSGHGVKTSYLKTIHDFKMRNLSYTVPQWPFLPLQRTDQHRVYVRFHSEDFENRSLNDISVKQAKVNFLSDDKVSLWNEANEIVLKRAQLRSALESAQNDVQVVHDHATTEHSLWVEKYKPKKYFELLSAEMANRSLLYWLKMWDKIVFGKEFEPKKSSYEDIQNSKLNTFNKRTKKFESNGGWLQRRPKHVLNTDTDEYGRPIQKVALLHGPPGLGKTTLAYVLAKHSGYEPIEINASDDRSPKYFQQALENGTQMTSVLNENKRPNCIILDEIDGAPRQSIEILVKFVTDSLTVKRPKRGEKATKTILKRPIICICNDLYTPALRSLRQIAFIVQFPSVEKLRLEHRLNIIAKLENLKTDGGALYALVEKTSNDVRSCLSIMQFFKSEGKALTLEDVLSSKVGLKDRNETLFALWSKIFQIQRQTDQPFVQHSKKGNALPKPKDSNNDSRVGSVLQALHNAGDYERLMQGVYENFLAQKMSDSSLNGIAEGMEWFCFFDKIQQQIHHQQNYSIYPYLQFCFVKWHLLFASLAWPQIKFPTRDYEFNQKCLMQRNIFESLRRGIPHPGNVIGLGNDNALLLEAIPYIRRILAPKLPSLPVEMFSQGEKQNFKHAVDIMIDIGITYIQVKSQEDSYHFQMEPDVESLSKFTDLPDITIPYITRQLLSREADIERMKRAACIITTEEKNKKETKQKTSEPKSLPNHLQKLQPKAIKTAQQSKANMNMVTKYFIREKPHQASSDKNEEPETPKADPIVKSPIWFHYKEGFNNAVRKDVHVSELL